MVHIHTFRQNTRLTCKIKTFFSKPHKNLGMCVSYFYDAMSKISDRNSVRENLYFGSQFQRDGSPSQRWEYGVESLTQRWTEAESKGWNPGVGTTFKGLPW